MTLLDERTTGPGGPDQVSSGDAGGRTQTDVERARALAAERRYEEAERVIAEAVRALEKGGESPSLAEALTLQGVALARLGRRENSVDVLRRAVDVAGRSGASRSAAEAALTLIEEHGALGAVTGEELYDFYRRADGLLRDSQNAEEVGRLRACARVVLGRLAGLQLGEENFTLFSAVHEVEARLITRALEEGGGSVTRAARLLGVRHQTLAAMLQTRHRGLQTKRTPPEKRRRSIIKRPKKLAAQTLKAAAESRLSGEG